MLLYEWTREKHNSSKSSNSSSRSSSGRINSCGGDGGGGGSGGGGVGGCHCFCCKMVKGNSQETHSYLAFVIFLLHH